MPPINFTSSTDFWTVITEDIFQDILEEEKARSKNRKRKRTGRTKKIDYWQTPWGILIKSENVKDIKTKQGKLFRRRFRVPFLLFLNALVPMCREYNIFDTKNESAVRVPLEFKILFALRILGRGNCCDDIAEIGVSFNSTHCQLVFQKIY